MTSKIQDPPPPPPYPRRRGRTPKPTSHPLGRVIRDRRLEKGLSLAQLAEAVGIGPTSVSLVAAMEHGTIPPRRDVAERLAAVLDLDREPLLMWAETRMSPRTSDDALLERARVESHFLRMASESPLPAWLSEAASRLSLSRWAAPSAATAPDEIPILPAGADPDTYRRRPIGYLNRADIERLVAGRAALVRPFAYELSDDDYERFRRDLSPLGRPLHALVSRPEPVSIDPREPYAIRIDERVILAYCAWDGRELVVLQPPGGGGFARLKARRPDLDRLIVGQVVALNWWKPQSET